MLFRFRACVQIWIRFTDGGFLRIARLHLRRTICDIRILKTFS